MRTLLPLLLLAACEVERTAPDDAVEALPADEAPAPMWHHFAFSQVVAGFPAGGAWTRRQPGATVTFLMSEAGPGLGPCAPSGAPCLDLVAPLTILGRVKADRDGLAKMAVMVPPDTEGTHWIQAAEHLKDGTWRVSEVVERDVGFVTCPAPGSQDVCAADHDTYASECEAQAAGWPVMYAGACPH